MNQRKDVNEKYAKVMAHARKQMGPIGKAWSHIIHFLPIEILLNLLDKTILRPIPLLTAGMVAFMGGLGLYSIALYNGYSMNGAAIPLLLIGGLFIGIIFDYLRIFFNGSA